MTTERELKFRAWDNVAKQMSPEFALFGEFTLVGAVFAWQADFREGGDSLEKLNDLTIMQFTGLTDKEGKEIYDKDILEDCKGNRWLVFWHQDHACFGVEDLNKNHIVIEVIDNQNMKVVGNIYQSK